MKKLLTDYSYTELLELISSLSLPAFRAKQLYGFLLSGTDFSDMSNIPKDLREKLSKDYAANGVKIIKTLKSKDGSEKYLYGLNDGETVEGVFLPNRYGNTLCVSTQAGCRMGCAFCASGKNGLMRNLSAGEILGQFIAALKAAQRDNTVIGTGKAARAISNIVLMGSGEPLDNFDQTVKFLSLVSAKDGLNVSPRNISVSTCGLVPEIRRLAESDFHVTLSLSLHATDDETRKKIMPIAKKYSVSEVVSAMKYYFEKTGRRVVFEYSLIAGLNDTKDDVKRLCALVKGFPCHVNLIYLNKTDSSKLRPTSASAAAEFLKRLTEAGISASIRRSYGSDIKGACGQLRAKFVAMNNTVSGKLK
jgi:23S rRNA (adenine2503-C2)-methyltransferase